MIVWKNLDAAEAYKKLQAVQDAVRLRTVLDKDRVAAYSAPMACGLRYNYAAKKVDGRVLQLLQELADEQQLVEKYRARLAGEIINTGENRKVLHHLARGQLGADVVFQGKNMRQFYE